MQQKIFVTGGTGFLGSYLLRYLVHQGYSNIYAIKRPTSSLVLVKEIANQINWIEGDILDHQFLEEAMNGMEQVYHSAAMVSFDPRDATTMLAINEQGTANIVNTALLHNIKKLVHISSIAAIGQEIEGQYISEVTKWKSDPKNSTYAKSKYAAEMQVWRGIAEGLNAAILNPSVILGSGIWNTSTCKIFQTYGNGFPLYSTGTNGFVDVRDVAKLAIKLMESSLMAERFIVSAENLSMQAVFNEISQQAGQQLPKWKITPAMISIGWRLEWLKSKLTGKSPLLTKESARSANKQSAYSNQKSVKTFDYDYIPIEQTIKATVAQFLEAKTDGMKARVLPLV